MYYSSVSDGIRLILVWIFVVGLILSPANTDPNDGPKSNGRYGS